MLTIGTKVSLEGKEGEIYYVEERPLETIVGIEFPDGEVQWVSVLNPLE